MNAIIKSIGVEVELAAYQKRKPVTCWFLPYTKAEPLKYRGHLLHKDASMFELAVAPATEPSQLDVNMAEALGHAMTMVPEGTELKAIPAVEYTATALEADPYASELGCGASENIYGPAPMPEAYEDNYRYGGTHVNIGFDGDPDPITTILKLDYALGLHSVAHFEQGYHEEMKLRRRYYGRAGEYRVKPFGLEYRTLPNCAVMSGLWLWRRVEQAMTIDTQRVVALADDIQRAINTSDRSLAEGLIGEDLCTT